MASSRCLHFGREANSATWNLGAELRWLVELCRRLRLAHDTHRTYGGHQNQFVRFYEAFELDPPSFMVGVYFAMGHTVHSVDSFMSAVQSLYNDAGVGELPRSARFLLFKRGLKRLLGPADEPAPTVALAVDELERILLSLDRMLPKTCASGRRS